MLGFCASAAQARFDNELGALKAAFAEYGTALTDVVVGISVDAENLYRISPTGVINKAGAGADPSVLVSYIQQVRHSIRGYPADMIPRVSNTLI